MLKKYLPLIAIFLLIMVSCGDKGSDAQNHGRATPVKVATVATKDVPLYRNGIGYVRAPEDISVYSRVQGEIVSQSFKEGDFVKKGDPLFIIDPRPFQAELDGTTADIERVQAEIAYQESLLERYESLVKKEYVSQNVFDKALSQLRELQASLKEAQSKKFQAELDLEYCYIKAPTDGVTSITLLDPGVVITDTTMPLVSLKSVNPIYVDFVLPQKEVSALRKYKKAAGAKKLTVIVKTLAGESEKGTLKTIQNSVNTQTGTIDLRGEFENKDGALWPGEYVDATLYLKELTNAVLVPQEAIKIGNKGTYVFLVNHDKTVEMRHIDLGQRNGDEWVVNKGLEKGDLVVTLGQMMLAPGAKVTW